ncbi:MAG: tetratricopeptide repeat protein [Pseudomonadota bacterium]
MASPETNFLIGVHEEQEGLTIRNALESAGYFNSTVVGTGPEALKILEKKSDFFFIVSWELPRLGGLRFVKEVRLRPPSADQPCVLIVQRHYESEFNMSEGVLVNGFLPRPLNQPDVAAKIQQLVNEREDSSWETKGQAEADKLIGNGRAREAVKFLERGLASGKKRLAGLQAETGLALQKQGRLKDAMDYLEKALAQDPTQARALAGLGRTYLAVGRFADAGKMLEKAMGLDPRNQEVRADLAESLLSAEKPGQAEELFRKLIEENPENLHYYNRLGIALRKQGKYRDAAANYHRALSLNDRDENLYFNLSRSLYETGKTGKALAAAKKALEINPDFIEAQRLKEKIQKGLSRSQPPK